MKNKMLFALSFFFGLLFINSGLNKIFKYMPMLADMHGNMLKLIKAFKTISWLMPLIAVV
jgi:hypothetical protein